jgi:hypothetical protein
MSGLEHRGIPADGTADISAPHKETGVQRDVINPPQELLWNLLYVFPGHMNSAIEKEHSYFKMQAQGVSPSELSRLMMTANRQDLNTALNTLPRNVIPLSVIEYGTDQLTRVLTPTAISIDSSPFGATIDNLIFLQIRLDDTLNREVANRFHEISVKQVDRVTMLGHFHVPTFDIYDIAEFQLYFRGGSDLSSFTDLSFVKDGDQSMLSLRGTTSLNSDPLAELPDVLMQNTIANTNNALANGIDQYCSPSAPVGK